MRVGADVEILRPALQQQIADAAADQIGRVIELLQPIQDLEGVGIDVAPGNGVFRSRNDHRLAHQTAIVPRATIRPMVRLIAFAQRCVLTLALLTGCSGSRRRAGAARRACQGPHALQPAAVRRGHRRRHAGAPPARHRRHGRHRARPRASRALPGARRSVGSERRARGAGLRARRQPRRRAIRWSSSSPLASRCSSRTTSAPRRRCWRAVWSRAASTDPALAEAVIEWWGSAVERLAGTLPRDPRHAALSPALRWRARGARPAPDLGGRRLLERRGAARGGRSRPGLERRRRRLGAIAPPRRPRGRAARRPRSPGPPGDRAGPRSPPRDRAAGRRGIAAEGRLGAGQGEVEIDHTPPLRTSASSPAGPGTDRTPAAAARIRSECRWR